MMMRTSALLLCLAAALPAVAQTGSAIQIRVRQQDNVFVVPNGSTLNLTAAGVGRPASLNVTITYQGSSAAVFAAAPSLLGSAAFSVSAIGQLPVRLEPNSSLSFDVTYSPTSAAAAGAQLSLAFTEPGASASAPSANGSILLNLNGTTPDLTLSYALSTNGNITPVTNGGTLAYGEVPVNATVAATFIVLNRGSGTGVVRSVTVTGDAFQLVSLPLLPSSLAGGANLQFGIRYSPKQLGPDTGTLQISFGSETATIALTGAGSGSTFSYELLPESGDPVTVQPNQVIPVPDTKVGERFSYIVRVRNNGNATGPVNLISVSGNNFAVTDLPFLPFPLAPNEFLTFTLVFQPTQPGRLAGRLRVGNDLFEIAGNGIGSRLTFSYNNGTTATAVQSPGAILFSPLPVGQTSTTRFEIRNEGTAPGVITSLGIADTRGVFRIEQMPPLPASLEPGATLGFNLIYRPSVTGLSTSQLLVDTQVFTLSGFASEPPPLPGFRFGGASGTVEPFQQPGVRLSLLDPYPIPLQGTLTIAIDSESFAVDPAVLFASGGRTVGFTIPAGSTEAVFPNGAREIRLQTGTVAGTITITPAFATQTGLELTPPEQGEKVLTLTVPRRAPGLIDLQPAARSADAIVLTVSGFTTTRSLRSVEVQFTPRAGAKVGETRFPINIEGVAASWFRSSTSQAFGGQFTLTLPFSFRTASAASEPLINSFESVSVVVTNDVGSSERLSLALQ